ncbi:MAG: hypothetical protein L0H93_16095, partial [Nocardioides sp.]|nr:hypothetical protein [Nocardioides sp.]
MNPDLEQFIGSARWFGGKGRVFTVTDIRRLGTLPAGDAGPRVAVDLAEVTYQDSGDVEFYQLPLAFRRDRDDHLDHALVGEWDDADFGPCHVYDAPHDRDAMALWLAAFATAQHERVDHDLLTFHRLPGHEIDGTVHSTLFSGEQSNSSVAFGDDSLMKIFRKVTPGVNPDIQVHDVLTEAGSEDVAALYGWLDAVDPRVTDGSGAVIQLAMLQQFLRTGSDGWELAQSSVR